MRRGKSPRCERWCSASKSVRKARNLPKRCEGRRWAAAAIPRKCCDGRLDGVLKRNRARWVRNRLVRAGMKRAAHLGWPNTYTFTKSLGESMLAQKGRDLAIAIVRPSIVESSKRTPFHRME